jgi:hypothetical protein
MEDNGLPSRTSILTAAARAFGSREPDASVRNPDWAADRLISPAELALIAEHPISKALDQNFQQRREAALNAMDDAGRQQAAQSAAMSGYWLVELAVPQRPS